jgi:hypothetical protein
MSAPISGCTYRQTGSRSAADCMNTISAYEICGTTHMLITQMTNNSIWVVSKAFPRQCDITLIVSTTHPFPSVAVSGSAEQGPIMSQTAAEPQILQNDFLLSVGVLVWVAVVAYLTLIICSRRKRRRGHAGKSRVKRPDDTRKRAHFS